MGVLVSLCIYGVLQERLMTIPYGGGSGDDSPPPEFFRSSIFLVLMNRLVTVAVSATGIFLTGERFSPKGTPLELYAMIAFGNLVTTVCQYEVLKYLRSRPARRPSAPRSSPVMCWGRLILNKRHSAADFVSAFVVTAGASYSCWTAGCSRTGTRRTSRRGSETPTLLLRDWSRNGRRPGLALARAPRVTASRLRRDERPRGRATLAATVPGGSAAGDVQLARLGEDPFEAIAPNKFVDSLLPRGQLQSWRSAW